MTNQEINIAIAEACGWKWTGSPEQVAATASFTRPEAWVVRPDGELDFRHNIPSYTTDLNAMHEAEKALTDDQWAQYQIKLGVILHLNSECPPYWDLQMDESRAFMHSRAEQRAEAFLRAINKWKE